MDAMTARQTLTQGHRYEVTLLDHGLGRRVTEELLVHRVDRGGFLGYTATARVRYVAFEDVVTATRVQRYR